MGTTALRGPNGPAAQGQERDLGMTPQTRRMANEMKEFLDVKDAVRRGDLLVGVCELRSGVPSGGSSTWVVPPVRMPP